VDKWRLNVMSRVYEEKAVDTKATKCGKEDEL